MSKCARFGFILFLMTLPALSQAASRLSLGERELWIRYLHLVAVSYRAASDAPAWIERLAPGLERREFLINGRLLKYQPTKPLIDQLRKLFPNGQASASVLLRWLLPEAQAIDPGSKMGLGSMLTGLGQSALGTMLLAQGL